MSDPKNVEDTGCYELWRQDDNGNKFMVKHADSQDEADKWVAKMTARGHKQTYWSVKCSKHASK